MLPILRPVLPILRPKLPILTRTPLCLQVGVVAAVSASATYLSLFLRMDTTDLLAALYSDCKCAQPHAPCPMPPHAMLCAGGRQGENMGACSAGRGEDRGGGGGMWGWGAGTRPRPGIT